ncbi:MAG: hypothetical protein ABJM44_00625, partial [Marinomonas sp.]
ASAISSEVPRSRVARLFDARAMVAKFERLYHAASALRNAEAPRKTYPALALQVEGTDEALAEVG